MPANVHLEMKERVALVTIDRPDALNALNAEVLTLLLERIQEALRRDARAIVLTGTGKAFVAGGDIADMAPMGAAQARTYSTMGHEVLRQLEGLEVPLVAAINGYALGGGTELALACDVRVASEKAVFGLPEVTLGVIPGFGGTQRLSRTIGLGPALDLVLTGRRIDAHEALRLGLVTHVVPPEQLLAKATELAAQIAANGPVAVRLAKNAVRKGFDAGLDAADALEIEAFAACFATADQKEGMRAFLEKRKPAYKGQ